MHTAARSGPELLERGASPLSGRVASLIVALIASGAIAPGERLNEVELARRARTSRVPIREALKALEKQGIVVSAPYRGTHVADFNAAHQADVVAARLVLEKLIVERAAPVLRRDPALLAGVDRALKRMRDCVLTGDRFGINAADVEFHGAVCQAAGSAILATLWEAMSQHVLIGFGLLNDRYPNAKAILVQHRRFREVLLTAPLDTLDQEVEDHILGRDIVRAEPAGGTAQPSAGTSESAPRRRRRREQSREGRTQ